MFSLLLRFALVFIVRLGCLLVGFDVVLLFALLAVCGGWVCVSLFGFTVVWVGLLTAGYFMQFAGYFLMLIVFVDYYFIIFNWFCLGWLWIFGVWCFCLVLSLFLLFTC